ncbi:ABC transporter ATP-binding protein, partial [Bordetella petrii]|nr:ABC transporter ATP-binding protein [Bordetella petrii]
MALLGLNGYIVEVEADIGQTLPNFLILGLPDAALCRLRGHRMAMVFQEPMTALNPVHPIGRQ